MKDGEVVSHEEAIRKLEERVDVLYSDIDARRVGRARMAARELPSGDGATWRDVPLTEFTDDELRRIANHSFTERWWR